MEVTGTSRASRSRVPPDSDEGVLHGFEDDGVVVAPAPQPREQLPGIVADDGLDPLTGKERRRWHPAGYDRHEAEQMAERIERDHAGPAPDRGGPTHIGDFLTDTWLPVKRRHVRASTADRYPWFVNRYINPAIGHAPLRRLRADHLEGLYDQLATTTGGRSGDGLAPKTVHEVHVIVRSSLDLVLCRLLATNSEPLMMPPAC